jgi:hypothetical protein
MGEQVHLKHKLTDLDFSIMEELALNPSAENKDICNALNIEPRRLDPQQLLAFYIRDVIAPACEGIVVGEVSILLGNPGDLLPLAVGCL